MQLSSQDRLWSNIDVVDVDDCWVWKGATTVKEYGRLRVGGRKKLAYQYAYELVCGPVPDGLELDHLCRNRACCNPFHLEPTTHQENVLRGVAGLTNNHQTKKTHCPSGHPYSDTNTRKQDGQRRCIVCRREQGRSIYHRQRELHYGHYYEKHGALK